jgi:hypothetical protein
MESKVVKSILNKVDVDNVRKAIDEGGEIWDNKLLAGFKKKFKAHYRFVTKEQCCYCRKNTVGEFNMVLDIEHVLPKKKFPEFMFAETNLSVSCKRCNMLIKGDDTSFIVDEAVIRVKFEESVQYKFIHPNVDVYFDHISYLCRTVNDKKIIKYSIVDSSQKGSYTYEYFKLFDLEVDSINLAQGIHPLKVDFQLMDSRSSKAIVALLNADGI